MLTHALPDLVARTPDAAHGLSDAALVTSISCRDEAALGAIFERYQRLLYGVALRITHDHAVADEVVQDTLYAVWRSAGQFQPDRSVAAWLCGLVRHRAIDALRSRVYRARLRECALADEHSEPEGAAHQAGDQLLLRQTVRDAIRALPPAQREVVVLAYFGGLTHRELAAQLGLPVGTVKSRLRAAHGQLRLRLGPLVDA
jgi:RNA polymerase sigma-70 factor (ECF subfamily)